MTGEQTPTNTDDVLTENEQRMPDLATADTVFSPAEAEVVEAYVGHDDRSLDDVAEVTGKNPWTVRTLWQRAREKISQAQRTVDAVGDYPEFDCNNRGG